MLVYLSAKLPEGKPLSECARALSENRPSFSVYDYFDSLEQRDGGQGALSRTSEATSERTLYCCVLW